MFLALIITILVFLSVYTLVYNLYLNRQMHLSLTPTKAESLSAEQSKEELPKEKISLFRHLLRPFGFMVKLRLARSLANRSVPSKLVKAGHPLTIVEFIIFKIFSIFALAIAGTIMLNTDQIVYLIPLMAVGFIIPDIWLNLKIKRRQTEIRRDLPMVIDLLNLCVNSGLDFMLAVNRVARDFKKCPLTDELSEVWRETRMGASRRDALQHLSKRINIVEMSSFVRTLLQADRMGSPMGEALKIQSEEIRLRRYLQGEEMALKAPIKLLLPLILFILPAVLVIVAGPIFLQFMRGGFKF